jgi:hypothetical protein
MIEEILRTLAILYMIYKIVKTLRPPKIYSSDSEPESLLETESLRNYLDRFEKAKRVFTYCG